MGFKNEIKTGLTEGDGNGAGLRTNMRILIANDVYLKKDVDSILKTTGLLARDTQELFEADKKIGERITKEVGLPGVVSVNTVTTLTPLDGARGFSATSMGAIKIRLPNSWNNSMLKLFIEVYDYTTNESFSLIVSGYLYTGGTTWYNTSVQILGSKTDRNFTVRFGHDGTKCCIYIGELNSAWRYVKVAITRAMLSHLNYSPDLWLKGWQISIETKSLQNITRTHANNLPVSKYYKNSY
tara:strand:+ start:2968 stop:3687 length:720 start_codon:yes stop_codon:yes gene_type:complete